MKRSLRTSAPSAVKSVQSEKFLPKFVITNGITTNHDTDCDTTRDGGKRYTHIDFLKNSNRRERRGTQRAEDVLGALRTSASSAVKSKG